MRHAPPIIASPILASIIAGLGACSPYSPELGGTPYLCADTEPRCPDDYTCKEDSGRAVCVSANGTVPDAPGGFACSEYDVAPVEPNDTKEQAYQTDVSAAQARRYGPLAICPATDRDHFQINVGVANKGIEAITSWDSGTPVSVSILNSAGSSIANGMPMGENALRACVANVNTGAFYAVAFSTSMNNYKLDLRLVDACQ